MRHSIGPPTGWKLRLSITDSSKNELRSAYTVYVLRLRLAVRTCAAGTRRKDQSSRSVFKLCRIHIEGKAEFRATVDWPTITNYIVG